MTQRHSGRTSFETTIIRYVETDGSLTPDPSGDGEEVELSVCVTGSSYYAPASHADPEEGEVEIETLCVIEPEEWVGTYVELTNVEQEDLEMELVDGCGNPDEGEDDWRDKGRWSDD